MKIKNICIISKGYPSEKRMINTFVEQLVNKFSDYDIKCYVIAPQSISQIIIRGIPANKRIYNRVNKNGKIIKVFSPYYISFSNIKKIINTNYLNLYSFEKSVKKVFKKLSKSIDFDIIYAHFIFPSAIVANKIGKEYNIPVFFAYGESSQHDTINYLKINKTRKLLQETKGVIAVSGDNKKRLIENKIVPTNIIKVFPNGIDNLVFYKKNKKDVRKKIGFSEKDFIVIFVGRYIELKGINRLCEALKKMKNQNIKAVFIGNGPIKPDYKYTIFEGSLDHEKIPDYLSASDIFVLPTSSEGCCNAIIEALACGLPVVSSKKTFNDILDETCSIRINEMNIDEIKHAIEELYNNKQKRKQLSDGALEKSKHFNLDNRTKGILNFIESKIESK